MEYTIADTVFHFYVKPYFLRLTFKQSLRSDGDNSTYDPEKHLVTIQARKQKDGEFFENLNMLTFLLSKPNIAKAEPPKKKPLIEVMDTSEPAPEDNSGNDFMWDQNSQGAQQQQPSLQTEAPGRYGFDRQYKGYFANYSLDMLSDLVGIDYCGNPEEIDNPDTISVLKAVSEQFDVEYYANDFVLDKDIKKLMAWKSAKFADLQVKWTATEQQQLMNLPKKELAFLKHPKEIWISLVDIMCSYCYNHRATVGENNVESGWTLTKMSCTLSWLEEFHTLQHALISFVRRVLVCPLYRHYEFARACIFDAAAAFKKGREFVLRCLLEIKYIFEHSSNTQRYLLNKLYIDDYCIWVQHQNQQVFNELAQEMEKFCFALTKQTPGIKEWDLETIEQCARESFEEDGAQLTKDDQVAPMEL